MPKMILNDGTAIAHVPETIIEVLDLLDAEQAGWVMKYTFTNVFQNLDLPLPEVIDPQKEDFTTFAIAKTLSDLIRFTTQVVNTADILRLDRDKDALAEWRRRREEQRKENE